MLHAEKKVVQTKLLSEAQAKSFHSPSSTVVFCPRATGMPQKRKVVSRFNSLLVT